MLEDFFFCLRSDCLEVFGNNGVSIGRLLLCVGLGCLCLC